MNLFKLFSRKATKQNERGFEILDDYQIDFVNGYVKFPERATEDSAGHDICAIGDYVIAPGKKGIIDTGLTAFMGKDEFLALFVRSGLAYKNDLTLQNAAGIVDADYYGKHIKILLRNEGTEPFYVKDGDRIAQGIFLPYLKSTNEPKQAKAKRNGGFGSTGVAAV